MSLYLCIIWSSWTLIISVCFFSTSFNEFQAIFIFSKYVWFSHNSIFIFSNSAFLDASSVFFSLNSIIAPTKSEFTFAISILSTAGSESFLNPLQSLYTQNFYTRHKALPPPTTTTFFQVNPSPIKWQQISFVGIWLKKYILILLI